MPPSTIAEALGHPPTTPVVIVHARELGLCHAANDGVYRSLREGIADATSLIVPAPWSREAAVRHRGEDVGVELTVIAEHPVYRWGPITHAPSLLGGDGGFPDQADDVWEHTDTDDLRREARAQIERAVLWGFDISHLHVHLGVLLLRPELFDVVLELAVDFGLPLTPPDAAIERDLGYPLRALARDEGVVMPDRLVDLHRALANATVAEVVAGIGPGVTVIGARPAFDVPELRSLTSSWPGRVADLELLEAGSALQRHLDEIGAVRTDFRALRELQRAGTLGLAEPPPPGGG